MKPCIAYIRVSTQDQSKGLSPEAQLDKILQWAKLYDYEVAPDGVLSDDGISGKTTRKRAGVQEAIALACERHCPLVFYSQSRLIRNTEEAIQIERRMKAAGADLVSITERIDTSTVDGWFTFILRALLDEREVLLVGERTRNVLGYKKRNGQRVGSIPYGQQIDHDRPENRIVDKTPQTYYPHYKDEPGEQKVLAVMLHHYEGEHSLNATARRLNELGYHTRSGKPWTPTQVRRALGLKAVKRG